MSTTIKKERIEARVTAEKKQLLAQAAAMSGRSLTDFIIESAEAKALETIENQQIIRLSAENQRRFAEAILNPAPPNEALKAAYALYKKTCVSLP